MGDSCPDRPSLEHASLPVRASGNRGRRGGALAPAPNLQRGPEIGPVRADFTRQECAPPLPPPRGGRPPCRLLEWSAASAGPSQHCRVSCCLHRLPRPGQGSGRIPRSASGRAATRASGPGPGGGSGTSPRPDPRVQRPLQLGAEHERGRLSRGISESISAPGRGARAAAVQSASDRKREPPLPSRSRA